MKNLFSLISAICLTTFVFAQVPQKMSYQAVVRNTNSNLVINQSIGMRISILQGSINGTAIYIETQTPSTNSNGLVSVEIGGGVVVSGSFPLISWENGQFFVKTEIDPNGGTSYSIIGTTQLLSVPYSFHSKTSEKLTIPIDANNTNITNLANPVNSNDAANKDYVDALLLRLQYLELETGLGTYDIDGNYYHAIKVGDKIWLAENLRTTHYKNGDEIASGKGNNNYNNEIEPKYWFVYNDDLNNSVIYGHFYTWYVVSDYRGICPNGWHVATDLEWKELEIFLGMNDTDANMTGPRGTNEGDKLKEKGTLHWIEPNSGATNEIGFNALPTGVRMPWAFLHINQNTGWWTATEVTDTNSAWKRSIWYGSSQINRDIDSKFTPYCIRCVKDY